MIREIASAAVLGATALVGWHHVGWPLLLRAASRRTPPAAPAPMADDALPSVEVIVPAYGEERFVAAKLRNLAAIDYPADRLLVTIACDGCRDGTVAAAEAALLEPALAGLRARVLDLRPNRGKVAVLNERIAASEAEVVALTDASAMLPPDALRRAAAHYADPRVGAVGGTYRLERAFSAGEAAYWRYQTAVKRGEAALGAPLGMHGAFWTFRRAAWEPVPGDTINDDFLMPMGMFLRGWGLRYDEGIAALEAEEADASQDARRRGRIAAGNAQQLARLLPLLHPRHGGVALAFASGKALRVLAPFLIALAGVGALALAPSSPFFAVLAGLGLLALLGAAGGILLGESAPKPMAVLRYAAVGHAASLAGIVRHLARPDRGPWLRAADTPRRRPELDTHVPDSVRLGKRVLDVLMAGGLLALSLPFWPLIALAVKLDSPGPVLFSQVRVGRGTAGRFELFRIHKFRSMRTDAEKLSGAVWASKDDPRVTRVGRFLRKSRLDELPQLLNVLKGEMSIVGPRPERPVFNGRFEPQIPFFSERTVGLRPGITGLAQVSQGYGETIDDARSKAAFDHAYAMRISSFRTWLHTDLFIAFRTFYVMALGRGQ